jgi:hypothetical protein
MDTGKLIGEIDSNLKKSGTEVKELTPPKAAEGLNNPAALEALAAKRKAAESEPQNTNTAGLLSSIDQKLQKQGVGPAGFEPPPAAPVGSNETKVKNEPQKKVEIEPKLALEKGPLFLNPGEAQSLTGTTPEPVNQGKKAENADKEPATRDVAKALVKGPTQAQPATAKLDEEKKPVPGQDQENKGVFDQLRQDLDSIGKVLNPFRW